MKSANLTDSKPPKELSAKERNDLFFERHDIAIKQERSIDHGFVAFGEHGDLNVLVSRHEFEGHRGRFAELSVSTAGHEWFLLERDTDELYEWLGKIIDARKKAKTERNVRIAEHAKKLAEEEAMKRML